MARYLSVLGAFTSTVALTAALTLGGCGTKEESADDGPAAHSSAATTAPSVHDAQLQEIMAGDFSSITGMWHAAGEGVLLISPDTIAWEETTGADGEEFRATVRANELEIVEGRHAGHTLTTTWHRDDDEYVWAQWQLDDDPDETWLLAFYPPEVEVVGPPPVTTAVDSNVKDSQTRILALEGREGGWPSDIAACLYQNTKAPEPAPTAAPSPTTTPPRPPVAGAYRGAGGGRPKDAKPITTVSDPTISYSKCATAVMPSGNIGCDIYADYISCYVESWPRDINPEIPDPDGRSVVNMTADGPAQFGVNAGTMNYPGYNDGIPAGQVLPYGTAWYYEDFVLASSEKGLTFWNTASGYGALINRDGMFPFHGK
ncbi:MAG: hypothetical protein Q4Q03_04670 [Bowdeniella nasicola]|nr:hypothetical protein [Bowdeniella nasicola]